LSAHFRSLCVVRVIVQFTTRARVTTEDVARTPTAFPTTTVAVPVDVMPATAGTVSSADPSVIAILRRNYSQRIVVVNA